MIFCPVSYTFSVEVFKGLEWKIGKQMASNRLQRAAVRSPCPTSILLPDGAINNSKFVLLDDQDHLKCQYCTPHIWRFYKHT